MDSSVKNIFSAIPHREDPDESKPFEYRTELTAARRQQLQRHLDDLRSDPTFFVEFIRLAAMMKYIGIPPQKNPDNFEDRFQKTAQKNVEFLVKDAKEDVGYAYTLAMINTKLLKFDYAPDAGDPAAQKNYLTLIHKLEHPEEDHPLSWEELACLRLLTPTTPLPTFDPLSTEFLAEQRSLLEDPDNWANSNLWHDALSEIAYARIAGVEGIDWRHAFSWSRMRELFLHQSTGGFVHSGHCW